MLTVLCLDVGSTFTKGSAVAVPSGELLATASHPTTAATDVLHGVAAVRASVEAEVGRIDDVRACSSAGGGLRLAVVGYERAVTAEAGSRVGLSAGARVVHVSAGALDQTGVRALRESRPDVVLLVGGTDGGNSEVLRHNATRLGRARLAAPVVVAGNVDARDDVCRLLSAGGRTVLPTANVLPRIGVLDPEPARSAIREVFITHVIGGKGLSKGPEFGRLVRAATPDAVLAGVELLADGANQSGRPAVDGAGDVVVVDVGGATTDVYSALTLDPEEASLHREVVEVMARERTVEGDLGMRWNASGTVEAAVAERLLERGDRLVEAARDRVERPDWLPVSNADREDELTLARLAMTIAVRRHARAADPVTPDGPRRPGKDLRAVSLIVGSGGVLRHADPTAAVSALASVVADHAGGWRVPENARVTIDASYVLAPAGLLAVDHRDAAARLLAEHLWGH